MPPKTGAERQAAYLAKRKAAGCVERLSFDVPTSVKADLERLALAMGVPQRDVIVRLVADAVRKLEVKRGRWS